jgi:8-oxo-dGTP diphosphatase
MKNKKFKGPVLATDGIILENGRVLMLKRAVFPFVGYWELPGGHVEYGETVEDANKREMKEELGVSVSIKKLFGVYSNLKSDPRHHAVSVIYLLKAPKGKIKLSREDSEFAYFSLKKLPRKIAFNHQKVLNDLRKLNKI